MAALEDQATVPMIQGNKTLPVDGLFVSALVFSLRASGMRVSPSEALACLALARSRFEWRRDDLASALAAVLVMRPGDRAALDATLDDLFEEPKSDDAAGAAALVADKKIVVNHVYPIFKPWWKWLWDCLRTVFARTAPVRRRVTSWVGFLARWLDEGIGSLVLAASVLLVALAGVFLVPREWRPPASSVSVSVNDPTLPPQIDLRGRLVDAVLFATSITGLALLIWRAVVLTRLLRRPSASEALPADAPARPQPSVPDDTTFRIGSLGRREPFLSVGLAGEIAEIIGYRRGAPDPRRLDLPRTIAAHARGADPLHLCAEARRELPTLLILEDARAEAMAWHTLADEFAGILTQRGVYTERIAYPGSFFIRHDGRLTGRPEAEAVEVVVGAPGWTVAIVFGEAQRLARADADFLANVAENGPVIFLDLHDRTLWDARQDALRRRGIRVNEATGRGLRDALAEVFAPDRMFLAHEQPAAAEAERPSLDCDGEFKDWASDCALVEPISFALAEELRRADVAGAAQHPRYIGLGPESPTLAFSRLAALPGSWTGPEGLRFDLRLRRKLLGHFESRSLEERRRTWEIVRAAFDRAPPGGTTAAEIRRYAMAGAQLHAGGADRETALDVIFETLDGGLLDPLPIRSFLGGLRFEGQDSSNAETILLSGEPHRAENRRRLLGSAASERGYRAHGRFVEPARWVLGSTSIRIRVPDRTGTAAPFGAFLPGARHLVLADHGGLRVLNMLLGEAAEIELVGGSGRVTTVLTAASAAVAAVGLSSGAWGLVRLGDNGHWRFDPLETPRFPAEGTAVAALDAQGRALFLANPHLDELVRVPLTGTSPWTTWPCGSRPTALACAGENLLAGLESGDVAVFPADGGSARQGDRTYRLGCLVTALAVTRTGRGTPRDSVVAASSDGRLLVHDGDERVAEASLGFLPRRIVPYANRPAARVVVDGTAAPGLEGISVAVLGEDGSFDVIGLAFHGPGGDSFTAMSLLDTPVGGTEGRQRAVAVAGQSGRLALLARDGVLPPRIDLRPLDYRRPAAAPAIAGTPSARAAVPPDVDARSQSAGMGQETQA